MAQFSFNQIKPGMKVSSRYYPGPRNGQSKVGTVITNGRGIWGLAVDFKESLDKPYGHDCGGLVKNDGYGWWLGEEELIAGVFEVIGGPPKAFEDEEYEQIFI